MQPKQKKKSFITRLNTVDKYWDLPDSEPIQSFLNHLKSKAEVESFDHLKECYLVSSDLKQAYFMMSLCFGGHRAIDYIQDKKENNQFNIQQEQVKYLRQIADQFNLDERLPAFAIFKENAKKLGQKYSQLHPIFNKAMINECQSLFKYVKSELKYLSGVKIRKWGKDGKQLSYRNQKREDQNIERAYLNGNTYLIIAETKKGTYNVGLVEIELQFDSECPSVRNSVVNEKINQNQQIISNIQSNKQFSSTHPQTVQNILPIENSLLLQSNADPAKNNKKSANPLTKDNMNPPSKYIYSQPSNQKTRSIGNQLGLNIIPIPNQKGLNKNKEIHLQEIKTPIDNNQHFSNNRNLVMKNNKASSLDGVDMIYSKPQQKMRSPEQSRINGNGYYVRISQKQDQLQKDARCPCCEIF